MRKEITLEYPYNERWEQGFVFINGEGRKHLSLIKDGKCDSLTSYARYLVAVNEGRFLDPNEHVDHIDHDNTNDVLENLQILTAAENNRKQAQLNGKRMAEIECPECGTVFLMRSGLTHAVKSKQGKVTCCSKDCSYKFKNTLYTKEERDRISEKSLLRVFQLLDNG